MGTILSTLAPIFLFSNWRTAGTALAFSFRKSNEFYVFTEPLNPTLRNADMALAISTTSWESKHPSGEYYFIEYAPFFSDDSLKFPEVENIPYVLNEFDMQEDLKAYFTRLISYAHSIHKIPVFKLEQSEGSAAWIRVNFPNSLYVGITRKADYQFISWLEQASFGNPLFFTLACQIINKNYKFFETDPIQQTGQYDIFAYQKIFDVFKRNIDIQHKLYMDFCIDISPESQESLSEQITKVNSHDAGRVEMWQHVLSKVKDSLLNETETEVMIKRLKIQIANLSKLSAINIEQANQINTLNSTLDEKNATQLEAEATQLSIDLGKCHSLWSQK